MALTAAAPIFKGQLADIDVRWSVIAASVDDRTPQERGEYVVPGSPLEQTPRPEMAGGGTRRLPKSRYGSVSSYLFDNKDSDDPSRDVEQYNDLDTPKDADALSTLLGAGIDAR